MKTHHHLWEQVVSPENLMGAATDAIRGKRCRSSAARFFSHWETEVWRLHGKLVSGEYQPGAYTHIKIYEPKERVVAAAPFRDRVVHYALVRVLQPIFEPRFLEDSYACRPGKGHPCRDAPGGRVCPEVLMRDEVRHPSVFSKH